MQTFYKWNMSQYLTKSSCVNCPCCEHIVTFKSFHFSFWYVFHRRRKVKWVWSNMSDWVNDDNFFIFRWTIPLNSRLVEKSRSLKRSWSLLVNPGKLSVHFLPEAWCFWQISLTRLFFFPPLQFWHWLKAGRTLADTRNKPVVCQRCHTTRAQHPCPHALLISSSSKACLEWASAVCVRVCERVCDREPEGCESARLSE